jgi:hypothetical protein
MADFAGDVEIKTFAPYLDARGLRNGSQDPTGIRSGSLNFGKRRLLEVERARPVRPDSPASAEKNRVNGGWGAERSGVEGTAVGEITAEGRGRLRDRSLGDASYSAAIGS